MKKIASVISGLAALIFTAIIINSCSGTKQVAGNSASEADITNSLDSSQWEFTAYYVNPQFGRSRQVNGLYSVVRKNNTLVVYLPYYGRASGGADVFSNTGPLDFTSTAFTPLVQKPSATEWRVTIKPKDNREVQTMNFTFFSNGTASLSVIMNNRSGISFTGKIGPGKKI